MYSLTNIYKILTTHILVLLGIGLTFSVEAREVTIAIKSLISHSPVTNAVVDLQSCHLGKFISDENGIVTFRATQAETCVLYISSSGFSTLVRSFHLPEGEGEVHMVFYMQKQDQYKTGRILSAQGSIPVSGVKIYKKDSGGAEELIGISDQLGHFGLINHYSGQYQLIFRHPQYTTQEKNIFIRREDGQIGSFYMEGHRPPARDVRQKKTQLTGISSSKFSFLGQNEKYIIIIGLYKNKENLPISMEGLDVQFARNGEWIQMFTGPYSTEKVALKKLEDIRRKYPQAMLKKE